MIIQTCRADPHFLLFTRLCAICPLIPSFFTPVAGWSLVAREHVNDSMLVWTLAFVGCLLYCPPN